MIYITNIGNNTSNDNDRKSNINDNDDINNDNENDEDGDDYDDIGNSCFHDRCCNVNTPMMIKLMTILKLPRAG